MLVKGTTYRRSDIHDLLGGNRQSGICPSRKSDCVFLFYGITGNNYGYKDNWVNDEILYYCGEGRKNNMEFTRGNKAILHHVINNKKLHLFKQIGNGKIIYEGEMVFKGYHLQDGLDVNKQKRKLIIFELSRKK